MSRVKSKRAEEGRGERSSCKSILELSETGERDSFVQSYIFHLQGYLEQSSHINRISSMKKVLEMSSRIPTSNLLCDRRAATYIHDTLLSCCNIGDPILKFWILAVATTLLLDPFAHEDTHEVESCQFICDVMEYCCTVQSKNSEDNIYPGKQSVQPSSGYHTKRKYRSPVRSSSDRMLSAPRPSASSVTGFAGKRKFSAFTPPSTLSCSQLSGPSESDTKCTERALVHGASASLWSQVHAIFGTSAFVVDAGGESQEALAFLTSSQICISVFSLNRVLQSLIRRAVINEDPLDGKRFRDGRGLIAWAPADEPTSAHCILIDKLRTCGLLETVSQDVSNIVRRLRKESPLLTWQHQPSCTQSDHDWTENPDSPIIANYSHTLMNSGDRTTLWTMLSLIETSCFRNTANAAYLTHSLSVVDAAATPDLQIPSVLTDLLRLLNPVVLGMFSFHPAHDGNPVANRKEATCRRDDQAQSIALCSETRNSLLSDVYFLQWEPYQKYILTEVSTSRSRDDVVLAVVCDDPPFAHPTRSADSESSIATTSTDSTGSLLGLHDIWLYCLKIAVNLSHKSPHAIAAFCECGIIRELMLSLNVLASWRCARLVTAATALATTSTESNRSLLDKFVFDGLLYTLSLLTNMAELPDGEFSECAACDVELKKTILLQLSGFSDWEYDRETNSAAESTHIKQNECSLNGEDVLTVLVKMLQFESQAFLDDIFCTEALLEVQECTQLPVAPELISERKNEDASEDSAHIPVDELVMATHVSLLVKVLSDSARAVDSWRDGRRVISSAIQGERLCAGQSYTGKGSGTALEEMASVVTKLPRNSWWLPKRILKAYLSLQHQTHSMIQENTLPVVAAIQSME